MEFPWEDYLLERKTENDLKDLLKTMVAFANSVRPEHEAVILIGERDDGTAQGIKNLDNAQKTIRKEADKIYPPIIWRAIPYEKDGETCIRIEIEYSGETPHFGGISWVRKGSETIKATDEVFQKLIELRSSKVRELSKWIDKDVKIELDKTRVLSEMEKSSYVAQATATQKWNSKLLFVNQFWITFQNSNDGTEFSEPLERVSLSYDNSENKLKIIIIY